MTAPLYSRWWRIINQLDELPVGELISETFSTYHDLKSCRKHLSYYHNKPGVPYRLTTTASKGTLTLNIMKVAKEKKAK